MSKTRCYRTSHGVCSRGKAKNALPADLSRPCIPTTSRAIVLVPLQAYGDCEGKLETVGLCNKGLCITLHHNNTQSYAGS